MLITLYLFPQQLDGDDLYTKAELAELQKVQRFLATADEITTMVADRVLTSDPATAAARERLLAGKSLRGVAKPQAKGSQTSVLTGKHRGLASAYFKELTKPPKQGPAKCFFPRHSIFARTKPNWLEIQICYECVTMSVTSKDGTIKLYTGINRNSRAQADKFFGYNSKNSKA